ncbi:MAG: saccharopine dehydrogenase C-terminal domain-containing protein [Planctomycetota bacterium]
MSHRVVVLGCGMVGATLARDLASDLNLSVTAADVDGERLRKLDNIPRLQTRVADLSSPGALKNLIQDFDLVVGALPSRFGFAALKTVVECGKCYSDISFMPEDALELDAVAKRTGATAVVDCGVSPGLSNMMIGFAHANLDRTDCAEIYVGGLPFARHWPFEYKAPFAPSDVVEEYTRPARLIENGQVVTRPALSEPELLDFGKVGTLEAFNTDGLRSLLKTVFITNMREKTLRYPGHIELMRVFRETGFFSKTPIDVGGVSVKPLDVTSRLLFPKWANTVDEEEFTVLRVIVKGIRSGKPFQYTFDLFDTTDRTTKTSSMARTTAFPCAIVARMLLTDKQREAGVFAPESVAAKPGVFDSMVEQLRSRGVMIETVKTVG